MPSSTLRGVIDSLKNNFQAIRNGLKNAPRPGAGRAQFGFACRQESSARPKRL